MSASDQKLNRRALLLGAIVLVGGAAALSRFSRKASPEAGDGGPTLSAERFARLEEICEVMIPTTDTPGARAAGVPAFIREMLRDWASATSRAEIHGVLDGIEKLAWSRFGAAFVELPPERRLEIMRRYDADGMASAEPGYRKFKQLVLAGYYHSQVGATQELRYELVPGAWRACVPYSEIGRASAV